jgi:hypothetical protein
VLGIKLSIFRGAVPVLVANSDAKILAIPCGHKEDAMPISSAIPMCGPIAMSCDA